MKKTPEYFPLYGKNAIPEEVHRRERDIFYGGSKPTLSERVLGELVHLFNRPPRERFPRKRYILLR